MKIYIDPGHGGDSIGAVYNGRKEQDDCLRLSLKVRDCLLTQKNVEVKMSRNTDINPELEDRAAEANSWGADYFLSLHRNASMPNKATGVEAWIYSKCEKGGDTYKKAEKVLNSVCSATGYKNRGVKFGAVSYDDYAVNRSTKMSSCLLETGFIDSDADNAIFDDKFNEMAEGIAKGVYEANGGKWEDIIIKGDVDGNGKISAADARLALRASVGSEDLSEQQKAAADMNGDGKITASDARDILRKSTGLSDNEPYTVKVTADALNIRKGAGINYSITGVIKDKGVYTIVEEKNGWGKLKSGAGWIKLAYTQKI